jgi:hypothetical protein
MTQKDPFARPARGQVQRARWRRSWDQLRLRLSLLRARRRRRRDRTSQPGATTRLRLRGRRRLAALESRLARDAPQLASMFDVFNQITKDEQPDSPERLPAPATPRLQSVHVAVLVMLAAVAALCFALSTQIRPVARQCTGSAAGAATTSAPVTSTGTPADSAVVRGLDCAAYATDK